MPDLWMDVDTALSEVPVNILPLLDDTDFKSRETGVAYNAAGMDLVWNFVTTAGALTQTAVTPTTGGDYDWTHQGDGIYTIEIPSSGGASINNDTEGFGWFTGYATGVLPWRGPTIGFRRAALNDLLIDGSTASTNLEDFFDGTGYAGGTTKLQVDAIAISGDTTAADNAELMFDGTGYAGGTTKLNVNTSTISNDAITAAAIASGAIDADAIAADAIGSSELAATAVAEIADGVWDELITAGQHNVKNSAAYILRRASGGTETTLHSGTAQSGTANTIVLDTGASATNDVYNGNIISLTSGTGAGQTRRIVDYVGASKTAYVDSVWVVNPDATTTFDITAASSSVLADEGVAQGGDTNYIDLATTASALDDTYNNSLVTIASGTGAGQTKVITDYTGASRRASIAPDTWSTPPDSTSVYAVIPSSTTASDSGAVVTVPTAGEVADAVWGASDRQLTALDEDATTIDLDGTAVGSVASAVTVGTNNDKTGYALAAGAITAAVIAADAIDGDAIAASAVTEIQAGLATSAEIGALNDVSSADVQTAAAAALTAYDPPTKAELDSAVAPLAVQTSVDDLEGRLTAARAGYLDNLSAGAVALEATAQAILTDTAVIGAAGAGLTAVPYNAAWDADIQSEVADALNAYDPPTKAELDAAVAGVTVTTNNDKAGYALSSAGVDAILDDAVDGAYTMRQLLRLMAAALFGKASGGGTTTITFRDTGDAKNRIQATVDQNGNRSAVTLDVS